MGVAAYRHPVRFYVLATLVPWAFWCGAAICSRVENPTTSDRALASALGILGLAAPTGIAFVMIGRDRALLRDALRRACRFRGVRTIHLVAAFGLMLASILAAMAISLLFGHSAAQFTFVRASSFSAGLLPGWFLLFLAPVVEELAWHSYGTDCLRARMSLLGSSVLFAAYWGVWHMPLAGIKDYYHANLAETHWVYGVNFLVSLFPFVVLMNWLYYRSGRSIAVATVFHVTAGVCNEMFATHPDSKIVQTVLLTVLAVALIVRDPRFFLAREFTDEAPGDGTAVGAGARARRWRATRSSNRSGQSSGDPS